MRSNNTILSLKYCLHCASEELDVMYPFLVCAYIDEERNRHINAMSTLK